MFGDVAMHLQRRGDVTRRLVVLPTQAPVTRARTTRNTGARQHREALRRSREATAGAPGGPQAAPPGGGVDGDDSDDDPLQLLAKLRNGGPRDASQMVVLVREALAMTRRFCRGADAPELATALGGLGGALVKSAWPGDLAEAAARYRQSLVMWRRVRGDNKETAETLLRLARVLRYQGDEDHAARLQLESQKIQQRLGITLSEDGMESR